MSFVRSGLINLEGNVTGLLPVANMASIQYDQEWWVQCVSGSDITGDGSFQRPWKTVQYAAANAGGTSLIHLTGFFPYDQSAGTIALPANVFLIADYPGFQINQDIVITGNGGNCQVTLQNVVCFGNVTWTENSAAAIALWLVESEIDGLVTFNQTGAGSAASFLWSRDSTFGGGVNIQAGQFTSTGGAVYGAFNYADSGSAFAFFEGTDIASAISLNGGIQAFFTGSFVEASTTLTTATTGSGTPAITADSGSIPASISGPHTLTLTSFAQHESYSPTTSANWNSVPTTVLEGLDTLATSGVVKSQSQNLVLASPNGSSGVPSFRALVSGDLPAGTGTVTSVAMTVPGFLSVAGSPVTTSGTLAVSYSGSALPVANGGTAVTSVTTSPTATAFAGWDANKNLSANNFIQGYRTTATAGGTTTLTISDAWQQYFTGSTTQTCQLPVVSTLVLGFSFQVVNLSSGVVTVTSSGGNTIKAMAANSIATYTVVSTSGTGAASWSFAYALLSGSGGSGTVTSVDVSGGTTGLTTSGGPVTTSGTITLAGTLAIANGGTGQTSASSAFNALSPITTTGDIIYSSSGTTNSRLAIGSTNAVLQVSGGVPAWGAVVTYGQYAPTFTTNNATVVTSGNITLLGGDNLMYTQIGSIVQVSGAINLNISNAGAADFRMTLPIASTFTLSADASGACITENNDTTTVRSPGGYAMADTTNHEIRIVSTAANTGTEIVRFVIMYLIR